MTVLSALLIQTYLQVHHCNDFVSYKTGEVAIIMDE